MSCCRNDNKWGGKQRDSAGNVHKKGNIIQVGKGGGKGRAEQSEGGSERDS